MNLKMNYLIAALLIGGLLVSINACESADREETGTSTTEGEPMELGAEEMETTDTLDPEYIRQGMEEYGRLLVRIGGCNNCHSPKTVTDYGYAPDSSRLLAGHWAEEKLAPINLDIVGQDSWLLTHPMLTAYVGPWGVSYAANLTPDTETGIGNWDEERFLKAMKTGMHMGAEKGRKILPPMPWFNLRETSDHDLMAIFAYLQSIPAIQNRVPEHLTLDQLKKQHPEMIVKK